MTRTPYILKEEELEILLDGMVTRGADKTYEAMKSRTFMAVQRIGDADEILMDQYDTILERARNLKIESEDNEKLQKTLYHLASILRILAHETYREYLKIGQERDSKRFLRLVK